MFKGAVLRVSSEQMSLAAQRGHCRKSRRSYSVVTERHDYLAKPHPNS